MAQSLDFLMDEDQLGHMQAISKDLINRLDHAKSAANLALTGMYAARDTLNVNEPKGLVVLFLSASASSVRSAVILLKLGSYSDAIAILRSALEALEHAALLTSKPDWMAQWYRIQVSQRPHRELVTLREELDREAKKALLGLEPNPQAVRSFRSHIREVANQHVHTTLAGLAARFAVDVQEFIPTALEDLADREEDLERLLDLYVLTNRPGFTGKGQSQGNVAYEAREYKVELVGRYDEDSLEEIALFSHYIAHRTLDLVESELDIAIGDEFVQWYKEWHRDIDRLE